MFLNEVETFTAVPVSLNLKKSLNASRKSVKTFISHIQRIGCWKKLLYKVTNPARGLLNREKRIKRGSLAAHRPLLASLEKIK